MRNALRDAIDHALASELPALALDPPSRHRLLGVLRFTGHKVFGLEARFGYAQGCGLGGCTDGVRPWDCEPRGKAVEERGLWLLTTPGFSGRLRLGIWQSVGPLHDGVEYLRRETRWLALGCGRGGSRVRLRTCVIGGCHGVWLPSFGVRVSAAEP
ncbi:MAG: hypothetical protein NTAFB05_20860 [Nitrobacter sp.]